MQRANYAGPAGEQKNAPSSGKQRCSSLKTMPSKHIDTIDHSR